CYRDWSSDVCSSDLASTPSRSATRNAESTDDPVCPVVSNLQLQIRVYLSRTFQVNRTNSVRFPPGRNRLFCFLHMATLRQASSLTLSSLVLFSQLSFAQSQPPAAQAPAERVRPDPKRARKAAEQGEKAEAAGHLEDALAAYEEAAHYAPKEIAFAERAAGLRSKLVRSYADEAERDAIAGRLEQADRKSTRLNSSHGSISYAVFCLKKKKTKNGGSE